MKPISVASGAKVSLIRDIQRLQNLDAALRSGGINIPDLAEEWNCDIRTVQRYLAALRELSGPTEAIQQSDGRYLQKYKGHAPAFFAKR